MNENFNKLIQNLESLIELHQSLLRIVLQEKNILTGAKIDLLIQNNKLKENTLESIAQANLLRIDLVNNICDEHNLIKNETRLLDLAHFFEGAEGERLRKSHSTLSQLLQEIKERNLSNESLIQNALNGITGAMNNVKDTLKSKPTYQKKGGAKMSPSESGQLVSRRA